MKRFSVLRRRKRTMRKVKKLSLLLLGIFFLILGIFGAIVPIVPCVPFLVIAAACFVETSPKMHDMLMNNRYFGSYLRRYKYKEGLSIKVKILTILSIQASFLVTIVWIIPKHLLWLKIIFGVLSLFYSLHILLQPGIKEEEDDNE
ncbi:MAG: YbaN family protein [Candidatus Cloacimonadaceae bacterium]